MNSVWIENTEHLRFAPLKGSLQTDVLVIGGGITGILCAYQLSRAGVDCVLVEAGRLCQGITKNTTAKITLHHGLIYQKLLKALGAERAMLYLEAQIKAEREYERLCQKIACNYEKKDSYVYSVKDRNKIESELLALEQLGLEAEFSSAPELPFSVAGAVRVKDQAQFHPLQFALGISKELRVYENTKILQLMPHKAITARGEITCKKIVIATHFPILNKHGAYFLKMYQHRSYVLALQGAKVMDGMYVDEDTKGLSFRSYQNLLLLGGGSHRTGKKGGSFGELEAFANRHYPTAKITHRWATQDCITLDGIPYIGQYARSTPNLYVATGFNKWGMSSAMVAAMLLSDLIQEKENAYATLFSPSRNMLRKQLAVNAFESLLGLLTPTLPRCPHLGCALQYNHQEHSWDCPCHGSRFTERGELIDNPATDDHKKLGKKENHKR